MWIPSMIPNESRRAGPLYLQLRQSLGGATAVLTLTLGSKFIFKDLGSTFLCLMHVPFQNHSSCNIHALLFSILTSYNPVP